MVLEPIGQAKSYLKTGNKIYVQIGFTKRFSTF